VSLRDFDVRGFTRLTLPFSQSGQHQTDHDLDPMVRKDPEASSDLRSCHFASSTFGGSTCLTLLFSQSRTIQWSGKISSILGSMARVTSRPVSGSGFNGGTDPMVMVKETARCRSTSLVTEPTGYLRLVLKVVKS
jgi:hypothetical protein